MYYKTTLFSLLFATTLFCQQLYEFPRQTATRWVSFENTSGEKGKGGQANKGAKGHAMEDLPAGSSKVLLDTKGSGIIHRMWITISDRSPHMLRSLVFQIFWDDAEIPAVNAPFGDFFGVGLGRRVPFENVFFSDPEGRSFNCCIPMPFKKAARIVIKNQSDKDLDMLFYDINFTLSTESNPNALYFYCYWNRVPATKPGVDYEILPNITGKGRFLGTNIGVIGNPVYEKSWWGEGEVKIYLDGDTDFPTLVGTGTEDYIGSAWGQGEFYHRFQGCLIADTDLDRWAFYRYHVPDPVYFYNNCRVTIQQIGGNYKDKVIELEKKGVPMIPISIHQAPRFTGLLEKQPVPELTDPSLHDGWVNFYRSDDISAAAYFYLDKPSVELPPLPPLDIRTGNLLQDKLDE
ncbi:DUF2961 domain-containing protein [candidate division KSB1 bacterium]|nr:DUF2961 domain-containing protein [candidate division KSB1 bacterium]